MPSAPLVIGYANNATSGKVDAAIAAGLNVVCWSFVDMLAREVRFSAVRWPPQPAHRPSCFASVPDSKQSRQHTLKGGVLLTRLQALRWDAVQLYTGHQSMSTL